MARTALRKEVELHVDKRLFDDQASRVMETNYVYAEAATYRGDLVAALPDSPGLPPALEACARFVKVDSEQDDMLLAQGPATSTTTAQQERETTQEPTPKWLSVLDENLDEAMEFSKLPALQGLLERMEAQAGRVVANELKALVVEGGAAALDELGRERLEKLCTEFHTSCARANREEELLALQWRVQALATNQPELTRDPDDPVMAAPSGPPAEGVPPTGETPTRKVVITLMTPPKAM